MATLVGQEYSAATLECFETSFKHTESFLKWKYGVSDMDIKKLNFEFVSDYEFWLKSERKCNHNSAIKYIGNFRKIVNRCIRNGWLPRDPFAGFKMSKREVIRDFLSEEELDLVRMILSDRYSWRDSRGRKNYPLLFNVNRQLKKVYWDVVNFEEIK